MRSYGQFCPVAKTAEILCQRWNSLIIRDLAWGSARFSELNSWGSLDVAGTALTEIERP